jgi:8-oxo-dGTP diphosphatase
MEPSTVPPLPRVGVAVFVLRGDQFLLGRRRGSHGAGEWALPGGHLEFGETIEDCARREVKEETGLTLGAIRFGPFSNDLFLAEGKHYVTLFVLAEAPEGTPELREPRKCAGWEWHRWSALPEPLFLPLRSLRHRGYRPQ